MRVKFLLVTLIGMLMFPLGAMAEVAPKLVNSYNMSRALELYNNNEFNEAFTYFQKELDDNKENYYAHTMVAKHYMWKREYGLALKSLNLAVKYADKKDETLVEILRIRSDLYGYMNDETKAKADLDQAVKLFPKSVTPYVNRSDYYVSKDQFKMAEKDMIKAMSIDETDRDVRMEYAIVLRNLDKYDEAISNLDYLIKMYPRNEYAYLQRSLCESLKGDFSSAVDDVIMVDKLGGDKGSMYMDLADSAYEVVDKKLMMTQLSEPNNPLWVYRRASIKYHMGDYKGAIKLFEEANNITYSNHVSRFIGKCWDNLGSPEMALKSIDQALAMDSTNRRYLLDKINYLEDLGRFGEAKDVAEKMVFYDPSSYDGYFCKACVEKFQGNITDAIDDFTMASIVDDMNPLIFLQRGYLYRIQGDEKSAVADFKRVLAIDTIPKYASCAMFAYAALGEREKAVEVLDSVLAFNAKENYYDAACLFARMNEPDSSIKYLQLAFENGYRSFGHIQRDEDLDNVKNLSSFKDLVAEYKAKADKDLLTVEQKENNSLLEDGIVQEIPFYHEGGVTKVKCSVNGLPLHFVFDTGASDVTLSMVEATFMLKNHYISEKDFSGKQYYQTADGNISEGATLVLKTIKIGELELHNIRASVVKSQNAPLLLGQSVLQQLGKIEIDNKRNILRITSSK